MSFDDELADSFNIDGRYDRFDRYDREEEYERGRGAINQLTTETLKDLNVDNALGNPFQKELVYWSFSQLLQKFTENLGQHLAEDVPSALNWLLVNFVQKPIQEQRLFFLRVLIFWTIRRLRHALNAMPEKPENFDDVSALIKSCLELEPLIDFLPTLMINVTDWLVAHDTKIIFVEDPSSLDAQDAFIAAWEDLFVRPFVPPDPDENGRMLRMIKDIRTRSDLYAHLIKSINDHVTRMLVLQRPIERSETLIVHPQIRAMKLKAEWLMRFICDNMHRGAPSQHTLKVMADMIEQVLLIYDPDPFSGLHDAADTLKGAMTKAIEKLTVADTPPLIKMDKRLSPLATLLSQKRLEAYERKFGFDSEPGSKAVSRSPSMASSFDARKELANSYNGEEVLVNMEDIWVEIDPIVDRIVIPSLEHDHQNRRRHTAADEILTSIAPGQLKFTRDELLWYGIDKKYARQRTRFLPGLRELAVSFPMQDITRFTFGKLPTEEKAQGPEFFLSGQADIMSVARNFSMLRSEADDVVAAAAAAMGSGGAATQSKAEEHFMAIFTDEEVYKFFPVSEEEVTELRQLLTTLTGLEPFAESEFVKDVLSQKLSLSRHEVLKALLQEESPWIEESGDLGQLIAALTAEYQPQQIVDMERLFHSCRIEPEVTKEAILLLRRIWIDSPSEGTKIKILALVDRLLDKVVMQKSDPIFAVVHKWLRSLEQTISPYRSPTALALVSSLVRRCKAMLLEPLTPIVRSHAKSIFTNWDDYNFWLHLYNVPTHDLS
ncbi:hypothetical protein BC831DRAFT_456580 [Entophlyctis helioformis]|nr:hypothetical protein BC831DRAFT_456580 [Entophlyctis helioformis]